MKIPKQTPLLVIDVQERLVPAIHDHETMLSNVRRLIAAAQLLDCQVVGTEQNPAGIGHLQTGLLPDTAPVFEKQTFDATLEPAFADWCKVRKTAVVCGMEAHVCVTQTVLGMLERGCTVFVVRDGVGSRTAQNRDAALQRLARAGAHIVTTEMVIFEWLETAERPEFRAALELVK